MQEQPIPKGLMQDSQGRLVPEDMVKPVDKLRDQTVRELIAEAEQLQGVMRKFKTVAGSAIDAFVELSAEQYGAKLGGKKGNLSLLSFDGRYKVSIAVAEYLTFDERLQVAKSLIDECITEWTNESRSEIRVLINDAFQVDKAGQLNTNRILGLRRLDIADPKWRRAMQAISDSLQTVGSKSYIRFHERQADGSYKQISLDLASL